MALNTPTTTAPLPTADRIAILDVLRGFALMGILIMNMPGFSYSGWHESDGSHFWPGRIDQLAEEVRDALFSGKFNSLFSVLFGLGFDTATLAAWREVGQPVMGSTTRNQRQPAP